MYGFLRQRRWIGFALLAIFFMLLFIRLGIWQLARLSERPNREATLVDIRRRKEKKRDEKEKEKEKEPPVQVITLNLSRSALYTTIASGLFVAAILKASIANRLPPRTPPRRSPPPRPNPRLPARPNGALGRRLGA